MLAQTAGAGVRARPGCSREDLSAAVGARAGEQQRRRRAPTRRCGMATALNKLDSRADVAAWGRRARSKCWCGRRSSKRAARKSSTSRSASPTSHRAATLWRLRRAPCATGRTRTALRPASPSCARRWAEDAGRRRGIRVDPAEVVITPGAKPILFFTICGARRSQATKFSTRIPASHLRVGDPVVGGHAVPYALPRGRHPGPPPPPRPRPLPAPPPRELLRDAWT